MRQTDLPTLILDLSKLPGVTVISDGEKAWGVAGILPADRVYPTAALIVQDQVRPGEHVGFIITDCTSLERADVVRKFRDEKSKSRPKDDPKGTADWLAMRTSGKFVIWGSEGSLEWLSQHYRLR